MAYKSVYNGIIFIEGTDPRVDVKGKISFTYGLFGSQLKGLDSVKDSLANQAKSHNCNCVIEFNYGQKSSWLSLDDTKWFGDGKCGVLSQDDYNTIIQEINNK